MKKLHKYNSLNAWRAELNTAPTSRLFSGVTCRSQEISSSRTKFTGTEDYQAADALLIKGDKKSAKMITECTATVKAKATGTKPRPRTAVVGYLPHVPNYLAGRPDSMITTDTIKVKQKIMTVIINGSVPGFMTAKETAAVCANVVSAIKAIEDAGQRVNIYLYLGANEGNEQAAAIIKIKESGAALQPAKIAYPLINPSMLRRHFFRFIETRDYLTDNGFTYGYGVIDEEREATRLLKDNNIRYNKYLQIYELHRSHATSEDIVKMITG